MMMLPAVGAGKLFAAGLRSARLEVLTADGDGAVVVVKCFDYSLSLLKKPRLLPPPPVTTKLADRLRAALNLPPLPPPSSSSSGGGMATVAAAAYAKASVGVAEGGATPMVLITSPGRGQGSEMVMLLTKALVEIGLVELKCVVANLFPCSERANLVRGSLDTLGLQHVPCGVGLDPNAEARNNGEKVRNVEFNAGITVDGYDYVTRDADYPDGHQLLVETLQGAAPRSLAILCISALSDVAKLIKSHRSLFAAKTKRVVMMGGVDESSIPHRHSNRKSSSSSLGGRTSRGNEAEAPGSGDSNDFLQPDNAQNNQYDKEAASFVFKACQELKVQLVVCTRTAAYAAPVPAFIYDELAAIRHPIALRLRDTQVEAIVALWGRVCLSDDDPKRLGLPSRCDRNWFSSTFCGGVDLSGVPPTSPAVYAQVSSFIMYDPLALLLVDSRMQHAFFEPEVKVVRGVEHQIVGVQNLNLTQRRSSSVTNAGGGASDVFKAAPTKVASSGVKDVHTIRDFLLNAARLSLGNSMPHAIPFRNSSFVD